MAATAVCTPYQHLPKTAGTTMAGYVRQNVRNLYFFRQGSWKSLSSQADLSHYGGFFGHFNYGFHNFLFDRKVHRTRQVTMLRDPIERVISAYYYHGIQRSWEDCLSSGAGLCGEYENDMVKRLCGGAQLNGFELRALRRRIPWGTTGQRHLEQAKENLRNMAAVGITEYLDASVRLFNRVLGWQGAPRRRVTHREGGRHRPRPRRNDIAPKTIELIRSYNRLDLELYNYALELFRRQARAAGVDHSSGSVQD